MDHHIKEHYSQFEKNSDKGNFHQVMCLNEIPDLTWEHIRKKCSSLPRGWFELTHLPAKDRIEFVRDYWLNKLPYHPELDQFLVRFFNCLDDIAIFVIQKKFDDPFEAEMVYSIKNNSGFFRGSTPATEKDMDFMRKSFPDFCIPEDYAAFLQIHNGFSKAADCTGITPSSLFKQKCNEFYNMIEQEGAIITVAGKAVDPKSLIPFYESFGMPFYQCFWKEWYPEQEMGNVYYSGLTRTISNIHSKDPSSEGMAFNTFTDWLMFYMEQIES